MELTHKITKVSILAQLFIWSIALEPLLYFIILDPNSIGVGGHISRILQVIVIFGLFISFIIKKNKTQIPNFFNYQYRPIWLFLGFCFISSIISILFFNYYNFEYSLRVSSRPIVELIVFIYTFIYFIFLSVYFLKNQETINYLFTVFIRVFLFSFFIGIIDLLTQYFFQFDLISRHLFDKTNVGFRFHGFFGEPRDAFGATMFLISIYLLKDFWLNVNKNRASFVIIVSLIGLLSFSFSAIVSVFLSIFLVFIYYLFKENNLQKIKIFFSISFVILIVISLVNNSNRLVKYVDSIDETFQTLNDSQPITSQFGSQSVDIIPIWTRFKEIKELNLIPLLIGSGVGSASFENIKYSIEVNNKSDDICDNDICIEINNPRSNITRLIFENGLIGFLLFLNIFMSFIKREKINSKRIIVPMLVLLGCFLAHRSYLPFMYFGILIAVVLRTEKMFKLSNSFY